MCRQVSLIWSYSRFSSPRSKRFYAFIFASCKCVREIQHYLDSHFLQWVSCPELWNKAWREKHRGFGFALLVIYGEDPSILLCSAGTGDAGGNSGKRRIETRQQTPPPLPKLPQTCWWTVRTASASGFWNTVLQSAHTHTYIYTKAHTENKQYFKRDSWPLSPPQVRLLTFLLRDKRLSAEWPTFSFFFLSDCTH